MPTEITDPAYVPASGGESGSFSSVEVANQAARLALTGSSARGAVIQLDDDSVWALSPTGNPATSGDWRLIGRRSMRFLGSVADQAGMLALSTGRSGDWCHRADLNQRFNLIGASPSTLAHWSADAGATAAELAASVRYDPQSKSSPEKKQARLNTGVTVQVIRVTGNFRDPGFVGDYSPSGSFSSGKAIWTKNGVPWTGAQYAFKYGVPVDPEDPPQWDFDNFALGGGSWYVYSTADSPDLIVGAWTALDDPAQPVITAAEQVPASLLDPNLQNRLPVPILLGAPPVNGVLGTAQVITNTAAGTIASSGNLRVHLDSNYFPAGLDLDVAVLAGDTSSVWAGKVRSALSGSQAATYYTISGGGSTVRMTSKVRGPNDPAWNLAMATALSTATGATPSLTSTVQTNGASDVPGTFGALGQSAYYGGQHYECTSIAPMIWTRQVDFARTLNTAGDRLMDGGSGVRARVAAGMTRSIGYAAAGGRYNLTVSGLNEFAAQENATWFPSEWMGVDGSPKWNLEGYDLATVIERDAVTGIWRFMYLGSTHLVGTTPWLDFPWQETVWSNSGDYGVPVFSFGDPVWDDRIPHHLFPAPRVIALLDAPSIALDLRRGEFFDLALGGNRTLANPTNLRPGNWLIRVRQDATGGRTLAFGANYHFPGGTPPVIASAANAVSILTLTCFGGTAVHVAAHLDTKAAP